MTTIAYKNGVLAATTGAIDDGKHIGSQATIVRLDTGEHIACTGVCQDIAVAIEWFDEHAEAADKRPSDGKLELSGILFWSNGEVWDFDGRLRLYQIKTPFRAIGSGAAIAIGAMAAGASAEEAVRIACQYDIYSREPVEVVMVKPLPDVQFLGMSREQSRQILERLGPSWNGA